MNKLPNYSKANIPEAKITKYLLCLEHKYGGSKAKFFINAGFKVDDWKVFEAALLQHPADHEIVKIERTPFGKNYVIECSIHAPNGKSPCIRSIWTIEDAEEIPRLVTAYPFD